MENREEGNLDVDGFLVEGHGGMPGGIEFLRNPLNNFEDPMFARPPPDAANIVEVDFS